MKTKNIPLVLYAGDSHKGGTKCGVETIRRLERVDEFIEKNIHHCSCIIFGAGIRPDKPDYPPLKEIMRNYWREEFAPFSTILAQQDGWGTFKESLAVAGELKKLGETEFYICSSWYHIPRILLIWKIIGKHQGRTYKVHVLSAPSPRLQSFVLKEPLSIMKVFYDWYTMFRQHAL